MGSFYRRVRAWKSSHTLVFRSRLQRSLRKARYLGLGYYKAAAKPHGWPLGQRRLLFGQPFSRDLPRSICLRSLLICYDVDKIHCSCSLISKIVLNQQCRPRLAAAPSHPPLQRLAVRRVGGGGGVGVRGIYGLFLISAVVTP